MKACPYCDRKPKVQHVGRRQFLARCQCGAYAAFETPTGIRPAVMRVRKTAAQQWDFGIIHKDEVQKNNEPQGLPDM
jgi:hypothetical protein